MHQTHDLIAFAFGAGLPLLLSYSLWVFGERHRSKPSVRPVSLNRPEPPQGILPALANLFHEGKLSDRALAATIVDLMRRSYLNIVDKGDRIIVLKQKQFDDLMLFEKTVAEMLVARGSVAKTDLEIQRRARHALHDARLSEAIRSLYHEAVSLNYFTADPNDRYALLYLIGLAIFFVGLLVVPALWGFLDSSPFILFYPTGLILSGTVLIDRAKNLSALTVSGELAQDAWQGYRSALASWPTANPDLFVEYLPYAYALGVEREWSSRFYDEPFTVPDWFVSFASTSREDFVGKLSQVSLGLARDLFALRDPALRD